MSTGRVVVAGGGPAALEGILALRRAIGPLKEVVLVGPEEEFVYRPLAVAEPFGDRRPWRYPLAQLAERAGADHRRDALTAVDVEDRTAVLDSGERLHYDALLIAVGARAVEAIPGALTFWGRGGDPSFRAAIERLRACGGQIVFKVPHRVRWTLPLYELAMLSARTLNDESDYRVTVSIVTPEPEPLAIFAGDVSRELEARLHELGIWLHTSSDPLSIDRRVEPPETAAERVVVALPRWVGPSTPGLPRDDDGFLPTDPNQRVIGAAQVYAAGDATDYPVKQGGIATEQAAAAATTIAADLGLATRPGSVEPILRARLYTDGPPLFMRGRLGDAHRHAPDVDEEPLWWPGAKLYGEHLAPFLAEIVRGGGARTAGEPLSVRRDRARSRTR
jgi:sulfide:quinone oxidoreductase